MNIVTTVKSKRIYLSSPTMHSEEQKYIQEAFDTNWIAPLGANVDGFERELAGYVGVNHAAALSSGTAALHLAMKLTGIGQDDIVFCSDLTFSATANPVSYEKGIQVFIDSERDTWNMDPNALEKAFDIYNGVKNPKPKAVVLVHLYGTPARLDEIMKLCDAYQVPLIEDAAESLSAKYKGKQTGSFGKYGIFSFNGNKIITSSGGGMLVSEDETDIEKTRFLATQARDPAPHYQHSEVGYNYRMSNIIAGIGRGQLIHLDEHREAKKKIYERYFRGLKGLPLTLNPYLACSDPNFWLSCILLDKGCYEKFNVNPGVIMDTMEQCNIEARPLWKPMHLQPVFAGRDYVKIVEDSVSEDLFNRGLCLPSDIKMDEAEQERVIEIIRDIFKDCAG